MRDHRHGRGGSAGAGTARPPGSVGEAQLMAGGGTNGFNKSIFTKVYLLMLCHRDFCL